MRSTADRFRAPRLVFAGALAAVIAAVACSEAAGPEKNISADVRFARGGAGGGGGSGDVTVSAAVPDTGAQGVTIDVIIKGNGFTSDMEATWELDGVADPVQVRTNRTTFVSSKQINANITIGESATIAKWDIRVQSTKCCKGGVGVDLFEVKVRATATDPTATWMLPLADGGLAFRSDGQFSDGTYSVYANGVCNVDAKIFATTQKSNTGDAIVRTNAPGKGKPCGRSFTLVYPDGYSETLRSFNNLRKLQNTTTLIPVGVTAKRQLILNPSVMEPTSRCDRLLFGIGDSGNGVGSDSVLVTRLDARTWRVQSDGERTLSWCQKTGELFAMPVDLTIVASYDLPQ